NQKTEEDRRKKRIRQDFLERHCVLAAESLGNQNIGSHAQADEKCGHQHDDRQRGGYSSNSLMTQEPANPYHIDDAINRHQNIAEHDRQCKVNDLFGNVAFRKILHGFLWKYPSATTSYINDKGLIMI